MTARRRRSENCESVRTRKKTRPPLSTVNVLSARKERRLHFIYILQVGSRAAAAARRRVKRRGAHIDERDRHIHTHVQARARRTEKKNCKFSCSLKNWFETILYLSLYVLWSRIRSRIHTHGRQRREWEEEPAHSSWNSRRAQAHTHTHTHTYYELTNTNISSFAYRSTGQITAKTNNR